LCINTTFSWFICWSWGILAVSIAWLLWINMGAQVPSWKSLNYKITSPDLKMSLFKTAKKLLHSPRVLQIPLLQRAFGFCWQASFPLEKLVGQESNCEVFCGFCGSDCADWIRLVRH
jgi:hypothetical protein